MLQDMHSGGALLGYFPTYALGSAFAAQFYHQMEQDIDVEEALRSQAFEQISGWLNENIHQYGAYKDADELMMDVCGEA
ncbi:carboxypeptidase M32, partial [Streptococcus gordonii]|nr:carboxypeptidase M32 [Streptococcus gordonii]